MAKPRTKGSGSIRQLTSGRYQARVKVDGRYYSAPYTFDYKEGAAVWLRGQLQDVEDGVWQPPTKRGTHGRQTFGERAEAWLTSRDLKPRTREHYRDLLDKHLLPRWGSVPLKHITPAAVESWYTGLTLKPTIRAHTYALMRTVMMSAWRLDLIDANPCRVEGAGSAKRASKTVIPTPEQVGALAEAMPPGKYRVMTLVAAWCGLRFGELTELRHADFTVEEGVPVAVSVSRAVTRVGSEYVVGEPKSEAGVRVVVIPPHIRADVAAYIRPARGSTRLLFPGRHGGHMGPSTLYWHFHAARDQVGLDGLRFHDLRHFAGTTYAQAGATLAETMGRLGHSTVEAAMRYQGVAAGRDAELAEAMSNVVPIRKTS